MARMVRIDDLVESAATGDEVAAFELALCYASGSGVEIDLVQAHCWFNVAAAYGYAPALDWRHEIAMELSARETNDAQRQARAILSGSIRKAA